MTQKDLPPPKTWSQINILIFGFPKTPKTAFYVLYFCRYELSNVEGRKSNFSCQKRSKFQILSNISVIYLKRKLRTCTRKIQPEKVRFPAKKIDFFRFFNFFPKARGLQKFLTFNFPKFSKTNCKNGSLGTSQVWKGTKSENFENLALLLRAQQ